MIPAMITVFSSLLHCWQSSWDEHETVHLSFLVAELLVTVKLSGSWESSGNFCFLPRGCLSFEFSSRRRNIAEVLVFTRAHNLHKKGIDSIQELLF